MDRDTESIEESSIQCSQRGNYTIQRSIAGRFSCCLVHVGICPFTLGIAIYILLEAV